MFGQRGGNSGSGHRPASAAGGVSPGTDHGSVATDHRPSSLELDLPTCGQVVGDHVSPTTDHRSPATDHRSPATDHQSPVTDHRPPTTVSESVVQPAAEPSSVHQGRGSARGRRSLDQLFKSSSQASISGVLPGPTASVNVQEGPPLVVGGGPDLPLSLLLGLPLDLDLEAVDTEDAVTAPDMVGSTDVGALAQIVLGTTIRHPPPLAGRGGSAKAMVGTDHRLPLRRYPCLLYTSPSPRDLSTSRMPSSA